MSFIIERWDCELRTTDYAYNGGGDEINKAIYLKEHAPSCGDGEFMNSAYLVVDTADQSRQNYYYYCCATTSALPCTNTKKTNEPTAVGAPEGNPTYLDQQNVDCEDQQLTYFRLLVKEDTWKYEYRCCISQQKRQCFDIQSSYATNNGGQVKYLSAHAISCPEYYGISRFQLENNNDRDQWQYIYRCCEV